MLDGDQTAPVPPNAAPLPAPPPATPPAATPPTAPPLAASAAKPPATPLTITERPELEINFTNGKSNNKPSLQLTNLIILDPIKAFVTVTFINRLCIFCYGICNL